MNGKVNKMVDYTIDEEKWTTKKDEVSAWFDANPDYASKRQLVEMLFTVGDEEPDMRKRHWASIASVFATVPNSPISKGRRSLMDGTVLAEFKAYLNTVNAEAQAMFESNPCLAATARTHGKSGGLLYCDMDDPAESYAEDREKKERLFLNAAYNAFRAGDYDKAYHWDGTYSDGCPVIIHNGGSEEE